MIEIVCWFAVSLVFTFVAGFVVGKYGYHERRKSTFTVDEGKLIAIGVAESTR